ncbi:MAG: hypothetical protein AAFP92_18365 [Bacteroidota bacterium]
MLTIRQLICVMFGFALLACNSNENGDAEFLPHPGYIKGYEIEKDQILYQYFEKFGFTDICIHIRSYFAVENWSITDGWKELPMTSKDISKVNSIPNKIDSLESDVLSIFYQDKDFFADISLSSDEFIRDTVFAKTINLKQGYYRLTESTFEVYDSNSGAIYYENHSCDF